MDVTLYANEAILSVRRSNYEELRTELENIKRVAFSSTEKNITNVQNPQS